MMIDWILSTVPVVKLVHIAGLSLWCGGLLVLPIMLARHDPAVVAEDYRIIRHATHMTYTMVVTPAAVLTVIAGTWLIVLREVFVPWLYAKLLFVALAFLSVGLRVHHMFTTGIPHMGLAFFSAASTLVAVPTAVQIFAWIGTMWKGRPELHLPMLHILGFFVTFVIGGLTGVMVAMVPFDWQAHDTGRKRFFRLGEFTFALVFIGFHVTFPAMHWVGLLGQRRRIPTYAPEDG
nr:cbb3-type cytochrome c oxidase subunit I [Mameliella sp. CS4]